MCLLVSDMGLLLDQDMGEGWRRSQGPGVSGDVRI
jgi:hypothetical protein